MNISEVDRTLLNSTNVYNASNGEYHVNQNLNRTYIHNSKHHKLIETPQGLKVVIDKKANDLDKVFYARGKVVPPDELLDMMKLDSIKIPMKLREEFKEDTKLPDSDLLKVIHYFVSKKLGEQTSKGDTNKMVQSMDETALIAMGLLIESWYEELITDETARHFLTTHKDDPTILLSDEESDSKVNNEDVQYEHEE